MKTTVDQGEIRMPFVVEPFTDECRSVFEDRSHVVLGVSPANSYFNIGLLSELLGWLRSEFTRIDVVIPDSALEHTYSALGYDASRVAKKARHEINALRNRVARAWRTLGGPREADGLHLLSDLAANPVYRKTLAGCEEALAGDTLLRETCRKMSGDVLARDRAGQITAERMEQAMRYLLAELPFFVNSTEIFEVPSSMNFYHRRIPLAELIFSGSCVLQRSPRQAYALVQRVSELPPR